MTPKDTKEWEISPKQQEHLDFIIKNTADKMRAKYIKGAQEHNGDLFDVDCLEEALDEVIDLMVYLQTELRKRK